MGLIFIDPKSGKEREFNRDSDNPYYGPIMDFYNTGPTSLCFLSDGVDGVARNAFIIPSECPLSAAPAIRLKMVESKSGHSRIHGWMGYFNVSFMSHFASKMNLHQKWIADVWSQHLRLMLYADLYYSYVNHLAAEGDMSEFVSEGGEAGPLFFSPAPASNQEREIVEVKTKIGNAIARGRRIMTKQAYHPGLSDPKLEEFPHLVYLKICLAWNYWESKRISWDARTLEAVELGICRAMAEDNFRKICKRAGLLVPGTQAQTNSHKGRPSDAFRRKRVRK